MASAVQLTKSFVQYAVNNGGSNALRTMHDEILRNLSTAGGKQLISSTLNGKSFSFAIPGGTSPSELLPVMLEAAAIYDEKTADGTLAAYLSARRATRTKVQYA